MIRQKTRSLAEEISWKPVGSDEGAVFNFDQCGV